MAPRIRRVIVLVALAASMSGAAFAQTACDQLLPIGVVPSGVGFLTGCANRYVLRQATLPPPPLSWVALEYSACPNGSCAGLTGPSQFVCEATSGYFCCIGVEDSIPSRPGTWAGPARSGLGQRFANDTDTRTDICFSDYIGNRSRVANVPLIESLDAGMTRVQVTGFQQMFLVRPPGTFADLVVEFIDGPTPARAATWGLTKVRYR